MKKLMKIMVELHPDIDLSKNARLCDDKVLDSLDIVTLVTDVNDAYGIDIGAEDVTPENFNSVYTIASLIKRYGGEICG